LTIWIPKHAFGIHKVSFWMPKLCFGTQKMRFGMPKSTLETPNFNSGMPEDCSRTPKMCPGMGKLPISGSPASVRIRRGKSGQNHFQPHGIASPFRAGRAGSPLPAVSCQPAYSGSLQSRFNSGNSPSPRTSRPGCGRQRHCPRG
jgi:hypothetical protein